MVDGNGASAIHKGNTTMHTITIEIDANVLESTVAGKVFQLQLADASNDGLVKVLRYGFQRLINDGCGGSDKTEADKHLIAEKRVAAVRDGSIAYRARTESDDEHAAYRRFIRDLIRRAIKPSKTVFAAYKAADDRNAFLDELFAKQSDDKQAAIIKQAKKLLDESSVKIDFDM